MKKQMAESFNFLKSEMEKFEDVIKAEKEACAEEFLKRSEEYEKKIETLKNEEQNLQ